MMTYRQSLSATLDELTAELGAAGWYSLVPDGEVQTARESVWSLIAERLTCIEVDEEGFFLLDDGVNPDTRYELIEELFADHPHLQDL